MNKRTIKRSRVPLLLLLTALCASLAVPAAALAADTVQQVDLSAYYNEDGFSHDTNRADGNYDGNGYTYSADLAAPTPTYDSTDYQLGSFTDGSNNAVKGTGQTIALPQGNYSSLRLLGSATGGSQTGTFRIVYTDASYTDASVTMSDWARKGSGDKVVEQLAHRHKASGDDATVTYMYAYYMNSDPAKTVKSVILPANAKMHVLAATLVRQDTGLDYRGRQAIPQSQYTVSASSQQTGHEIGKAFDGDTGTTWIASGSAPQTITIGLGGTYTISRLDYLGDATNVQNHVAQYKLYVSTDGVNYKDVVDNGNFNPAQYGMRVTMNDPTTKVHSFFDPVSAAYVKLELLATNSATYPNPIASEITVYRDTQTFGPAAPVPAPAPYVNPRLSLASQVFIEKGLQLHSWMPSDGYGREFPNAPEFTGMNMTGTTYYDPPLYNQALQDAIPGVQWNLAKAPYAGNGTGMNPPNNGDYLSKAQLANVANAVSICFGDEQGYSTGEEGFLKSWFALSHRLYPHVLVHTNQYSGEWGQAQLQSYMQNAQPDLLTFDHYYWDQTGSLADYQSTQKILNSLNYQRPLALQGIDGTGAKPIGFGQYLDGFKTGGSGSGSGWYEMSESQLYLETNLSLAAGAKWLDIFRLEYDQQYALLFDKDGFPTHQYYEFAENFRQANNWGPHLVRLNNVDVRVKPGQHISSGTPVTNATPSGWQLGAFAANTEFHISDVTATNVGSQNSGLSGDVAIGYFKALPGYDTRTFFTSTDPKYFMVVNGLSSGSGQRPENQHGTLDDTRQTVTLTFTKGTGLNKVNRFTGAVEPVALTSIGSGLYTLSVSLGGGEGELYYWDENKTTLSANANLLSLDVDAGTLSPAFSAATTSYSVTVGTNVSSAKVTAFSAEANATVTVNGSAPDSTGTVQVSLPNTTNVVNVVVQSEDGTTQKTYQLTITKGQANLALNQTTTASNVHSATYSADKATDGSASTRWATVDGTTSAWLEVDFGKQVRFNKAVIQQAIGTRINHYQIQYNDGGNWVDVYAGITPPLNETAVFRTVTSDKIRLNISDVNGTLGPTVNEFAVYMDPTAAATDPLNGKTFNITVKNSGLRMDVTGGSTNDGAAIVQSPASSATEQQFTFTSTGNGYYKIVNKNSGKALAVPNASFANNTGLVQLTYTADDDYSDEWRPVEIGSGYYQIVNGSSNKHADMPGASTTSGTQFIQYSPTTGDNQKYTLTLVP